LIEYKPITEEGPAKDREAQWLQGGEDIEEEEDFEWLKALDE